MPAASRSFPVRLAGRRHEGLREESTRTLERRTIVQWLRLGHRGSNIGGEAAIGRKVDWSAARKLAIFLIMLFFLYTRLKLLSSSYLPTFDSGEMEKGAASLAETGTLGNVFGANSGISAHLVPVYPILLAILNKIFGTGTPAGYVARGVMAVTFSATALLLLGMLARRTGMLPGVGLAAMAFISLNRKEIWLETRGDWEQNLAALYLIGLLFLAAELQDNRWASRWWAAVWGLAMGIGALLNPSISIPMMGLVMAGQLVASAGGERRRLLGRFALAGAVASCVVAPWIYRNYRAFHTFVPLRSNLGLELYLGNSPRATGHTFAANVTDHPHVNPEELRQYKAMGEIRYMKMKQQAAIRWIGANPRRFLVLSWRRALMFWFSDGVLGGDWSAAGLKGKLKEAWLGILALCGLAYLVASRHRYRWIYFAAMVGPLAMYLFTHVHSRYSYPIYGLKVLVGFEFVAAVLIGLAGPGLRHRLMNGSSSGV